jgi:hypothetical protein
LDLKGQGKAALKPQEKRELESLRDQSTKLKAKLNAPNAKTEPKYQEESDSGSSEEETKATTKKPKKKAAEESSEDVSDRGWLCVNKECCLER